MAESDDHEDSCKRITRQSQDAENSLVGDATWKRKLLSLDEALDSLLAVDNHTKVRGDVTILLAVDTVISHSMENGLDPSQLQSLVNVIVKRESKLTQTIRSKLVKCLIPSSTIPEDIVVRAICFIGQKIFVSPGPSNLDSLLLRWIILVLDYLDSYTKLHRLYGIIFNFVHSEKLLPHACQLLFILTRKEDVRLFRVEQLEDIMKRMGPEPAILGLLTCYKVFQPNLVSVRLNCSHKAFFKDQDRIWKTTITSIAQKGNFQSHQSQEGVWECEKKEQRLCMQPAKRQKQMVPKVHSAAREHEEEAEVDRVVSGSIEVPFEQVDSFAHFLQVIENIQCPSQIASSLNDPRLQLLLSCNPDPVPITRLCMWIQHFFVFGFDRKNGEVQEEKNTALLKLLCQFSEKVQSLPVVHGFLESFLPYWDGHSYIPILFSLISCIQPCYYEELLSSILQPLFRLFFASDVYFKAMCLSSLTKLIKKFVLHMYSLQSSNKTGSNSSQQKHTAGDVNDSGNYNVLTQEVPRKQEELLGYQDCIQKLMKYLDVVVVVAMRMEKDHILLQHVTLDLLETATGVYKMYGVPVLSLPIRVIYRLLLSDCPGTIARLCGVVNSFRENLMSLRSQILQTDNGFNQQASTSSVVSVSNACIDATLNSTDPTIFNSLLVDMLKMLWHGTIFTASRALQYKSIFEFPLPKSLEGRVNGKCMTLYRGPAFVGLAYKFLTEVEHQGIKLKPSDIEEFQELYLEFLDRENFPQLKEFVNINLKSRKQKLKSRDSAC